MRTYIAKGVLAAFVAASATLVHAPSAAFADATAPFQARVYATREGLMGGTTANGHKILYRDHFAALPSRRGLSQKGQGDHTVEVCADNGRCAFVPVWDVGPWNIYDDYWNSPRQQWNDLPRGMPEAQAAYYNGYNGRKDGFGRRVGNPAGIDLGDGTFWDGLLLTDNSWVTVKYWWTGAAAGLGKITTTGNGPLNMRSGPGTGYRVTGMSGYAANVPIECWTPGTNVGGVTRWDRLPGGRYISHAYVTDIVTPPRC
ncbi:MAG: hypothetical protein H0T78_05840 [Longispora sp.]|nr:hypothetical protein [Longispora sp. (in: high G+C Gram-positive bacteria)]